MKQKVWEIFNRLKVGRGTSFWTVSLVLSILWLSIRFSEVYFLIPGSYSNEGLYQVLAALMFCGSGFWIANRINGMKMKVSKSAESKDWKEGELNKALSEREKAVLKCLSRGMRNKEIADHLFISENTVKTHLSNLYQKLGVRSRNEVLIRAISEGFFVDKD